MSSSTAESVTESLVDLEVNMDKALELETLDVNLFRSCRLWKPRPDSRAVFGGQIIGQSLVAAYNTVDDESLHVHSLHSYFVRPGDNTTPAMYFVRRVRDGSSFSTRQVTTQQHGAVIFEALISFHREEASPLLYQDIAPAVPPPSQLPTRIEWGMNLLKRVQDKVSEPVRKFMEERIKAPQPLDMRNCDPTAESDLWRKKRNPREPKQQIWIRTPQRLSDRWAVHACVAAYASDMAMVSTAALASPTPFAMAASLDHSMWFHAPFRADEWMLYDLASSRANNGRALITGRLFREDGTLVVTVTQEALTRGNGPNSLKQEVASQSECTQPALAPPAAAAPAVAEGSPSATSKL